MELTGGWLRPGCIPERVARLVRESIVRCALDLTGRIVYTETATGAYAVTPVIAAAAGAMRVFAMGSDTRHGSVAAAEADVLALANVLGVSDRITFVREKRSVDLAQADIVTNSGHVRPIDAHTVAALKPGVVIPLMYEAWELRAEDVDVFACAARGIPLFGTNERNPAVGVFDFLGIMAVKQLLDAGLPVFGNRIVLLCDNDFAPHIAAGLRGAGAQVELMYDASKLASANMCEAVVMALTPHAGPVFLSQHADDMARCMPTALLMQFWGDIDRQACAAVKVAVWPQLAPKPGHMGILVSEIGPDAIVRLQTGGLKAAEEMLRARPGDALFFAQPLVYARERALT